MAQKTRERLRFQISLWNFSIKGMLGAHLVDIFEYSEFFRMFQKFSFGRTATQNIKVLEVCLPKRLQKLNKYFLNFCRQTISDKQKHFIYFFCANPQTIIFMNFYVFWDIWNFSKLEYFVIFFIKQKG